MTHTPSPQEFILAAIDKTLLYSEQQKQHKAQQVLPIIYNIVQEYPHILWHTPEVWKLAKAFMMLYHYDTGDNESKAMTIIKQAYIYAVRAVELCEKQAEFTRTDTHFNALHTQIMILSLCDDIMIGALADVYLQTHSKDSHIQSVSNKLAQKIIPLISYNILVKIDDTFENFNNNSLLETMCIDFELQNPDITPKQLGEAEKVHAILLYSFLHDCFPKQK